MFWVGLVGVGLVLPTALETWLLFFSAKEFEESRKAHWISFVSDAGVLVGGFPPALPDRHGRRAPDGGGPP